MEYPECLFLVQDCKVQRLDHDPPWFSRIRFLSFRFVKQFLPKASVVIEWASQKQIAGIFYILIIVHRCKIQTKGCKHWPFSSVIICKSTEFMRPLFKAKILSTTSSLPYYLHHEHLLYCTFQMFNIYLLPCETIEYLFESLRF